MHFIDRIKAIEERAKVINLTLFQICRATSVDYIRVHRWKTRQNVPTVNLLERDLGALEGKLDEMEAGLREALAAPSDDVRQSFAS